MLWHIDLQYLEYHSQGLWSESVCLLFKLNPFESNVEYRFLIKDIATGHSAGQRVYQNILKSIFL